MVTTTGVSLPATATTPTANQSLFGDFSTFLTLLTTQLQNQDPSSPLDTNEMTQQLVQFASVEQQISMNQTLGSLVSLQQAAQLTAAAPLMGKTVEVTGDQFALQSGSATVRLPAAGSATAARVQVQDATSGRTLYETQLTLGTQGQDWAWNGQQTDGTQLPDGAYKLTVSGLGANGEAVALSATTLATATGAERDGTDLLLNLGAVKVGFDQVRAVLTR